MSTNYDEPSGDSDNLEVLEVLQEAMCTTLDQVETQIGSIEEFDFATAVRLGMQYLIRDGQYSEITARIQRLRDNNEEATKAQERFEGALVIVASARKGIYSPARAFFEKLGQWQIEVSEAALKLGASEEALSYAQSGLGYIKIAVTLPDKGDLFIDDMLS